MNRVCYEEKILVSLTREMKSQLKSLAKKQEVNTTHVVRQALIEYMKRAEK